MSASVAWDGVGCFTLYASKPFAHQSNLQSLYRLLSTRIPEGLIDYDQRGFRAGRGCVHQIFTLKQIGEKAQEKKCSVYVDFMDLEKAWEALWQVLRIYDVGDKLLNGIRSMHINSLTCVRVKEGESEYFRINSDVRQGCIISTWSFNVYMDAVMKMKMGMGRREESEDCLSSCMQMNWFCVVSRKKNCGRWWDFSLRCVGEEV